MGKLARKRGSRVIVEFCSNNSSRGLSLWKIFQSGRKFD
jgi:hypothetical protein